jgi:hypothetical protein
MRVMPADTPPGTYTVQFDESKKFSQHTAPRVRFHVQVFRVRTAVAATRTAAQTTATTGQTWIRA